MLLDDLLDGLLAGLPSGGSMSEWERRGAKLPFILQIFGLIFMCASMLLAGLLAVSLPVENGLFKAALFFVLVVYFSRISVRLFVLAGEAVMFRLRSKRLDIEDDSL